MLIRHIIGLTNTRMKTRIREMARRFLLRLLKQDFADVTRLAADAATKATSNKLAALLALDVGFKDAGKVVLIARVNGRDLVKILDCPPNWSMEEYERVCYEFKVRYGARPSFQDAPRGYPTFG